MARFSRPSRRSSSAQLGRITSWSPRNLHPAMGRRRHDSADGAARNKPELAEGAGFLEGREARLCRPRRMRIGYRGSHPRSGIGGVTDGRTQPAQEPPPAVSNIAARRPFTNFAAPVGTQPAAPSSSRAQPIQHPAEGEDRQSDTPLALRVCPIRGDESMHLDTDPGLHGYPTNRGLPSSPTRVGASASSTAETSRGWPTPRTGPGARNRSRERQRATGRRHGLRLVQRSHHPAGEWTDPEVVLEHLPEACLGAVTSCSLWPVRS
jgi:hypothetical protein